MPRRLAVSGRPLLAVLVAAALAASCGGEDAAPGSTGSGRTIAVLPAASASAPAAVSAAPTPATAVAPAGSPAPASPRAASRPPAAATATAAPSTGARPGSYPVHISSTTSLGRPYDGDGTLSVAPAAAGGTQSQTITRGDGAGAGTAVLSFAAGGQVALVSLQGAPPSGGPAAVCPSLSLTFAPPVELVPAPLAPGTSWSGPVAAGPFSGSATGSVTGQGSDQVGGASVAVWTLQGTLTIRGRYCGYDLSATITIDSHWAPSLRLSTLSTLTVDGSAGLLHVTSRTATALLSVAPA